LDFVLKFDYKLQCGVFGVVLEMKSTFFANCLKYAILPFTQVYRQLWNM